MSDCNDINGYVDPQFPNPLGPSDACIIIYGYTPSLALSILGVVLFVMAFAAHCLLLFRHRTWYFSTVVLGTLMEIAGYVFRTLSSQKDPYSIVYFVVQYFMIVVAPVFFSAAIYTLITVMIKRIGRKYTLLPPQAILWIFIVCDVVATIVQIAGAALIGTAYSKNKDPTIPNRILLAGLVFQVVSFAIFISCLCLFVWKSRKATSSFFKSSAGAVFIATLAVYLRTCFRLAETAQGLLHYLSTHEAFFGCLEFLPIVAAVYIFIYWHPGKWLETKTGVSKALQSHSTV